MIYSSKQVMAIIMAAVIITGCLMSGCSGNSKKDDTTVDTSNATKKQDR